jgi:hypothetical protein
MNDLFSGKSKRRSLLTLRAKYIQIPEVGGDLDKSSWYTERIPSPGLPDGMLWQDLLHVVLRRSFLSTPGFELCRPLGRNPLPQRLILVTGLGMGLFGFQRDP